MNDCVRALHAIQARIAAAERRYHRPPGAVALLAVSKAHSIADVRAVLAAGQRVFGESYLQEAAAKIAALAGQAVDWHFIGPIQSNKTRGIAERFSWVHSVDRLKIAQRLDAQRPDHLPPLNICLEINVSGESSKSGVPPAEAADLARELSLLPRLRLRGLMAIPPPSRDLETQRDPFRRLRELRDTLGQAVPALDTLSMGMTDDLEAAIAEGSTMVRVGSGIFGRRGA
ncbi:MAG: YggS family pyridoxal phosphate-dependent enzyme [Gammaproteobacteria bacterium]|nr:YggS family pyridoxal phosphate-dependent enzyme [Gammaproteobacteria bacterium]